MGDQHRLDGFVGVVGQNLREALDRRTLAPLDVDLDHVQAHALAHVDPEVGELADAGREHLVAGRERVGQAGFPAAGAGAREQEHLAGRGLEHLLQVGEQRQRELGEVRGAHVLHRQVERAPHRDRAGWSVPE